MPASLARAVLLIALFCFAFAPVPTRADRVAEPAPAEAAQSAAPRPFNVDDFKQALPDTSDELSLANFLALKEKGNVVVLDVRSKETFAARHLAGSLNAPLTDLTEKTLPALIPDKTADVVLVCDYSFMPTRMISMTIQAYPVLKAAGYDKIHRLNLWKGDAGQPMNDEQAQERALPFEGTSVTPK